MPDSPAVPDRPSPETGQSGARRLWAALTSRPSPRQLIAAALLALLGYAAAVQIQLTHADNDFAGQRRQDLVELLDSLSGASDRAEQQISDLQSTRDDLQSSSSGRAAAIADPQGKVTAATLLDTLQELRDAGAEAVQVGPVRVVASTAFEDSDSKSEPAVVVDGNVLHPPYVFLAVGDPPTLSAALDIPGGVLETLRQRGAVGTVSTEDDLRITALHSISPPRYARPAPTPSGAAG